MLCVHLADQDVIGGGGEVKSDRFGARLAGFCSKIAERLLKPHAIATKDAKRPGFRRVDSGSGGFHKVDSLASAKESSRPRS